MDIVLAAKQRKLLMTIGEKVRKMREARSWSVPQLAKSIGVSPRAIYAAEEGRTCSVLLFVLLAEALDVTLDDLVPLDATSS
jgi:transcriptional regulator with XRE-family HTH domain